MTGRGLLCAVGAILAGCAALPGLAQTLPEGAEALRLQTLDAGEILVASGPWRKDGGLASQLVQGAVSTQSWQIPDASISTLRLMNDVQRQIEAEGFTLIYTCETADCGGFDFRFAIPTLPEPDMHVDLGDFRYLSARKAGTAGDAFRLVLISRGPGVLFVQITKVLPPGTAPLAIGMATTPDPLSAISPVEPQEPTPAPQPAAAGSLIAALLANGGAPLDDLIFSPGAANLEAGDYASLTELGTWLLADPSITVALVGHTDATGGLEGNIALSKRRAEQVKDWLLNKYALPPGQVVAQGVGYLAPRAPNNTPEGQAKNRRVEVMVTSTR